MLSLFFFWVRMLRNRFVLDVVLELNERIRCFASSYSKLVHFACLFAYWSQD